MERTNLPGQGHCADITAPGEAEGDGRAQPAEKEAQEEASHSYNSLTGGCSLVGSGSAPAE